MYSIVAGQGCVELLARASGGESAVASLSHALLTAENITRMPVGLLLKLLRRRCAIFQIVERDIGGFKAQVKVLKNITHLLCPISLSKSFPSTAEFERGSSQSSRNSKVTSPKISNVVPIPVHGGSICTRLSGTVSDDRHILE